MGEVPTGLTMLLDGFIAGPNDGPELPSARAAGGSSFRLVKDG